MLSVLTQHTCSLKYGRFSTEIHYVLREGVLDFTQRQTKAAFKFLLVGYGCGQILAAAATQAIKLTLASWVGLKMPSG